jgi:hypothetical protein
MNALPVLAADRRECHRLLESLPDEAIGEVLEFLRAAAEFHSTGSAVPASPLPASKSIPARLGRTYVRPEFLVSDEP